jgi:Putative F0F1-ATPase subunit Ca2+/Mg2+ transporter
MTQASDHPEGTEPEPVKWPEVPEPPPAPPIPAVLRQPVARPASMTGRGSAHDEVIKGASAYASALTFIGTILVFGGLGWGADWLLGSRPWGLVAGLSVGMIGATFRLVREANRPLR